MKALTSSEAARQILFPDGPGTDTGYDERDIAEVVAIIDRVNPPGTKVVLAILAFLVGLIAYILFSVAAAGLLKWHRFVLGGTMCLAWSASAEWLREVFARRISA